MNVITKLLIVVGIVIGLAVAWSLASPLFSTNRLSEELPTPVPSSYVAIPSTAPSSVETLAEGKFTGFDPEHTTSGTVRVIRTNGKTYVRFEDDFTVTTGPALFVYMGNGNKYDMHANVGVLQANDGSQSYEIPGPVDISNYSEVWVWCRLANVPFGKAILK